MGITYWPLKVRIREERRLDTRKGTTTTETLSVVTIAASARFEGSPLARGTDSVNPAGGSAPTTNDCVAIRRGPVRVMAHKTTSSPPPGLSTGLTTCTRSTASPGQLTYKTSGRPSGVRAAPIASCAGNVSHPPRSTTPIARAPETIPGRRALPGRRQPLATRANGKPTTLLADT